MPEETRFSEPSRAVERARKQRRKLRSTALSSVTLFPQIGLKSTPKSPQKALHCKIS